MTKWMWLLLLLELIIGVAPFVFFFFLLRRWLNQTVFCNGIHALHDLFCVFFIFFSSPVVLTLCGCDDDNWKLVLVMQQHTRMNRILNNKWNNCAHRFLLSFVGCWHNFKRNFEFYSVDFYRSLNNNSGLIQFDGCEWNSLWMIGIALGTEQFNSNRQLCVAHSRIENYFFLILLCFCNYNQFLSYFSLLINIIEFEWLVHSTYFFWWARRCPWWRLQIEIAVRSVVRINQNCVNQIGKTTPMRPLWYWPLTSNVYSNDYFHWRKTVIVSEV